MALLKPSHKWMKKFVLKLIQAASVRNRFTNDLEREFQIDQNFAWQSANAYLILTEGVCTCRTKFLLHRATNETKKVGGGGSQASMPKNYHGKKVMCCVLKAKFAKKWVGTKPPPPGPPSSEALLQGAMDFFIIDRSLRNSSDKK